MRLTKRHRQQRLCYPNQNIEIAFQRAPVLWHNGAEGEPVNIFPPVVNSSDNRNSRRIRGLAVPAVAAILLLAIPAPRAQTAAPQGEKSDAASAGNVERGKKNFTKAGCYECHGREGQGAAEASGPRIGPPQRFIRPFIKYVRQPTGQMPPYTSAVISDQELIDIYAYLHSRPLTTPSKDIPLLNQ
jgi:mono/diheme cytochrome c family protein